MTELNTTILAATFKENVQAVLPVGAVLPYAGHAAPGTDFLLCNGAAVSRTTYAKLFTVIGTHYGAGDGSTTFNVPDLRGRGPIGVRTMGASDSSRESGTSSLIDLDAYHDPVPNDLGDSQGQDLTFNFIIKAKPELPSLAAAYPAAP
tara:strand:+ start:22265 stop:22708 length:444 start_codon:yes stop_codon:yes gene_type:complete